MNEVMKPDVASEVQPYVPGVSVEVSTRAALIRFFPASAVSLAVVLFGLVGAPLGEVWGFGAAALGFSGVMTLGYWLGLEGMRRWLYPDAAIDGRRSVVAGLMSSLVLFILAASGIGVEASAAPFILAATGVVLAVVMFFAWLTPTPGVGVEERAEEVPALAGDGR